MRKNGREIENVNCKMFNEQIFEIFYAPTPSFPTPLHTSECSRQPIAARLEKVFLKYPKWKTFSTPRRARDISARTRRMRLRTSLIDMILDRSMIPCCVIRKALPPACAHDSLIIMQFAPQMQCELCVFTQNVCNRSMGTPERVSDS